MNDLEIKDIDKLKNLLVEFGVEFEEMVYHSFHEVNIHSGFSTITFEFTRDSGEFMSTCVD